MATHDLDNLTALQLAVDDGIFLLTLGEPGGRPFILNPETMAQFETVLAHLEGQQSHARGLIITGQQTAVFCAGADLDVLAQYSSEKQISDFIVRGQDLFCRLEALSFPTVAAIAGTCVGGGLELALACNIRLASDDAKTKLGLPEVRLGILPAWGGTTRLVNKVGLKEALPMLLSGRLASGRRARKIGLVAECCPQSLLQGRARFWLDNLNAAIAHGHTGNPVFRSVGLLDYLVQEIALVRKIFIGLAGRKVMAQTQGHYPAPLALLSILRQSTKASLEERLDFEHDGVLALAQGEVAKNLISIFRRNRDKDRGSPYDYDAKRLAPINRVAVIGAGVMGSGIATALLTAGRNVVLLDPLGKALVAANKAIDKELALRVKRRRLTPHAARTIKDRLILTDDYRDLSAAELVIESVPEIAELKSQVLASIVEHANKTAIICTNTSSLSIADLSKALPGRRRLYGLHFFNPAPKMPLVEIVRGPGATDKTLARLTRFCRHLGKTPVIVADCPAFVVNRLLAPYLLEAQKLLTEGAPLAAIESAARRFGLPMGPFELMDSVGLDIIKHVCDYLASIPELGFESPLLLTRLVERGEFGRKTKTGYYRWRGRKKKARSDQELHRLAQVHPEARTWSKQVIEDRLTQVLRREAQQILSEGVVKDSNDLDLASVFGMGFPPFTGGIGTWATTKKEALS